ncbi:major capsid protein P2 [Undibacterium sp. Ji42W]|uniref:major capsid protein P2 n=1 Tax=Undibacterium sp. Ji42W TaxID=3413039 RepID=UPI003BF1A322
MFNKPMQQVVGVAAGSIATLRVPAEAFTLVGLKLNLNFLKTLIDRVRIKVGSRVIWDLTYAQFNAVNNYKNEADNTKVLYLNFVERDQAIFPVKEVGGFDLMALLPLGEVYFEFYINAAAVSPTIDAIGYFEGAQGNPAVLKFVPFSFSTNSAGKFTLPLNMRGAVMKRIWLFYSGTAWTGATNGNVSRLEIKKNGLVFFDQTDLGNRFDQANFKKVPQAGLYVADFIIDNNHDAHITTMRRLSNGNAAGSLIYDTFEFNAYIADAGGATVTAIAEVLDAATNL